jgi:hypothetical protein
MKTQTVHQLRLNGWKVRVGHKRVFYRFDPKTGVKTTKICLIKEWDVVCPNFFLSAKGGITQVTITSPEGVTFTDQSVCNNTDHYNSSIGLQIAIGRTLSHFKNVL